MSEIKIDDSQHEDRTRFDAAGAEHHTTKPRIPIALRVYNFKRSNAFLLPKLTGIFRHLPISEKDLTIIKVSNMHPRI